MHTATRTHTRTQRERRRRKAMNNASESLGAQGGLRLKNCVTCRNLPDDDFQTNLSIAYFAWQKPNAKGK